jgi:hypothetical protein
MENSLSNIGDKTLTNIMIPGTHDAGSYEKYGPKSEDCKYYFYYIISLMNLLEKSLLLRYSLEMYK